MLPPGRDRRRGVPITIGSGAYYRRDARAVEWGGLENRCSAYAGPGVRIPLSPPPLAIVPSNRDDGEFLFMASYGGHSPLISFKSLLL
jgi:hypothetical protein